MEIPSACQWNRIETQQTQGKQTWLLPHSQSKRSRLPNLFNFPEGGLIFPPGLSPQAAMQTGLSLRILVFLTRPSLTSTGIPTSGPASDGKSSNDIGLFPTPTVRSGGDVNDFAATRLICLRIRQ
jgi:hypothetical protein